MLLESSSPRIRMVRPPLDNRSHHLLRHFNPLSWPCNIDLAIPLIDLNAAIGASLQIIDGRTLATDEVSNVCFGAGKDVRFHDDGCWSSSSILVRPIIPNSLLTPVIAIPCNSSMILPFVSSIPIRSTTARSSDIICRTR